MERRKILFIIISFFAFIQISVSQENKCEKYFLSSYPDIVKAILDNKDSLNLSISQNETIENAISNYEPMINERKKKIDELEKKLNDLILNGGDSSEIKSIIIKLAQLKAENTVLKIKEIREIQNSLTKSQYEKLLNYIKAKQI